MNKIIVKNNDIILDSSDDSLVFSVSKKNKFLNVKNVNVKVKKDTEIVIECVDAVDIKLDICINILKGVHAKIYEYKNGGNYKYQYKYYLDGNSFLEVEKVIDASNVLENTLINLNGECSKVNFNLKTISKMHEKYNFLVYHNAKKTVSNIINNGVNIKDGVLEFNVSTFIFNGIKKCDASQSGRIINKTSNECVIKPNLFIDENDVVANHSALIGTFKDDEIFYLMSRGLDKREAENLLTKGFLLKGVTYYKEVLEDIINKYWR